MATQTIDYGALADQARAPAQSGPANPVGSIDYAALAEQARGRGAGPGSGTNWLVDPLIGAGKGALSTVMNAGDLIRRGEIGIANALGMKPENLPRGVRDFFGLDRVIDRPEVQSDITPSNTAQKLGFYGEHAAEYLVPATRIAKLKGLAELPGAVGILARSALQATAAGGVAGAETGGNSKAMVTAGASAGLLSGAAEAIPAAARAVANVEVPEWAEDLVGLASPRAKYALNILGRIRKAIGSERVGPTPAPEAVAAAEQAPEKLVVPSGEGAARAEAQPAAASVPQPAAETNVSPIAEAPGHPLEAVNRDKLAKDMAEFLYSNGQGAPHSDALRMGPDQWKMVRTAVRQGYKEAYPSSGTTRAVLEELKRLEHVHNVAQELATAMNE